VFGEHIGRTVEAYIDDIVVKTRIASDLLSDLEVTFRCLKAKGVKLNPEKCVFGVPRGMLLGFIVSERVGMKTRWEIPVPSRFEYCFFPIVFELFRNRLETVRKRFS
jgi:hypothetical protein